MVVTPTIGGPSEFSQVRKARCYLAERGTVEKVRKGVDHNWCGVMKERAQELVETRREGRDNCPEGQAKTGRRPAKRGEKN